MEIAGYGADLASLRTLVDSVPALIHTARPDGYIDFFNQRWLAYLGRRLPDVEGWKWTAAVHPDDVDALVSRWRACLATGEPFEFESRVRRADGAYRWMSHQKLPLTNANGEIVKWYGSSVDIDDRKRAESDSHMQVEERRQAEFYVAEGQRLAQTGSWTFNAAGFDYWSAELFAIHGLPAGKPPSTAEYIALVHPDDREFVAREIQTMLAEHHKFDFTKRIVRPDGASRYVRCVGVPRIIDGVFQGFIGTGVDVTEGEELTRALRTSEQKFRLVIDGIAGLVATMTPRGDVDFVNRQLLEYFGKTVDDLKGWQTTDAVHPDDLEPVVALWKQAIELAQPYDAEHRLLRSDGIYRWFHASGRPLRDMEGAIVRWFVLLTDINERKQAEERLKEREAELRQMLDLTPQLVAVYGPDRERLYANHVMLDYLGLDLEQWKRRFKFGDALHPDDWGLATSHFDRSVSNGSAFELELRLRNGEGSHRWFLVRGNPVCDDNGQLVRWYVACTDIEDRKKAEERLEHENVVLREEVDKASMFEEIVGSSPSLTSVLSRVSKVARSDSTVLITGETGTGKELVARAIHRRSRRASRAFVSVNCAAIPRELIASELFGHEKGAFTGAVQRRLGRFELADGGTIFLDEVGELPMETQVALLRVLQEREFDRVGGSATIHVDVRVIAATNRDLQASIEAGAFRQDLFYRLNVFPIAVPPLRDRADDIPLLVEYFIDRYARNAGKTLRRVSKRSLDRLQSYPWPGNVRELQNVIERSVIVCDTDEFTVDDSWLSAGPPVESRRALSRKLAGHEKSIIEDALRASGGRVFGPSGAAARLGIARSTLESKIRALGINKNQFRGRAS